MLTHLATEPLPIFHESHFLLPWRTGALAVTPRAHQAIALLTQATQVGRVTPRRNMNDPLTVPARECVNLLLRVAHTLVNHRSGARGQITDNSSVTVGVSHSEK